jgi:acyl-CoA dehydrogenase
MSFLGLGRIEIGARAVGNAQWLLDSATEYANKREVFGDVIGQFQAISHKIAREWANMFTTNAVGLQCAWLLDRDGSAIAESSILKWFATNAFWEIADDVVEIHGMDGLSEKNRLMDRLHYARTQRIIEGTDEIQLNTIANQYGVEQ